MCLGRATVRQKDRQPIDSPPQFESNSKTVPLGIGIEAEGVLAEQRWGVAESSGKRRWCVMYGLSADRE